MGPILGTMLVGTLETVLSGEYEDIWPLFVGVFFLVIVLLLAAGPLSLRAAHWRGNPTTNCPVVPAS